MIAYLRWCRYVFRASWRFLKDGDEAAYSRRLSDNDSVRQVQAAVDAMHAIRGVMVEVGRAATRAAAEITAWTQQVGLSYARGQARRQARGDETA